MVEASVRLRFELLKRNRFNQSVHLLWLFLAFFGKLALFATSIKGRLEPLLLGLVAASGKAHKNTLRGNANYNGHLLVSEMNPPI